MKNKKKDLIIEMKKDLNLTDKQYQIALNNLVFLVKNGLKLDGFDSDTVGDKNTQCTWGLCGENPKVFNTADMHLFPAQLPGRLSPKYREHHHRCPFEDPKNGDQISGCFYRCRYFTFNKRPTVNEWLKWVGYANEWSEEGK